MTAQLSKEIRPLILPWSVALIGVALAAVAAGVREAGQFVSFVAEVGSYAFLGGLTLMAAGVFGGEFQHRTLWLLLSQPAKRTQMWRQKMFIVAAACITALAFGCAIHVLTHDSRAMPLFGADQLILCTVFVAATACSTCFWTLVAGSTLGGVVLTIAAEFLCGMVVALIAARVSGRNEPFQYPGSVSVIAIASAIYCGVFLWLGWRKFTTLQLREAGAPEIASSNAWFFRSRQPAWLVCRTDTPMLNLVRKEARLLRPLFQVARLYVLCWLMLLIVNSIQPRHGFAEVLAVATFLYVPLCSLLAGCIVLGEERALGTGAMQLTLPVRPLAQWSLKLVAAFVVALALGEGLAWLLSLAASPFVTFDDMRPNDPSWLAAGAVSMALFFLGFWAVHLVGNTVRAALVAVLGVAAITGFIALGLWAGLLSGNFEAGLLTKLMVYLRFSPEIATDRFQHAVVNLNYVMVAATALIMLYQSFRQFKRLQPENGALLRYSSFLGLMIFLATFVSVTLINSARELPNSPPVQELRSALNAIAWTDPQPERGPTRVINARELNRRVSDQTMKWLDQATISYQFQPVGALHEGAEHSLYFARVLFPNGQSFELNGGYAPNRFYRPYGR